MTKTVGEVGELALVERIRTALSEVNAGIECGPGDDAAIVQVEAGRIVLTTDSQREGVHFEPAWIGAEDLGRRALAISVSDLAAMGAEPLCSLYALALPAATPVEWFGRFLDGVVAAAAELHCPVVGGDVACVESRLAIETTVTGTLAAGSQPMLRSGARVGDQAWITGVPGLAAAGRTLLQRSMVEPAATVARAVEAYRRPMPRWRLGVALARAGIVHAAMDVSDGLGIDAWRMCEASGVGLELDEADLASPELDELSRACGVAAMDWTLGGGEDYELLCAVPAADGPTFSSLAAAASVAARRIGRFVAAGRGVELLTAGGAVAVGSRGWDPFADTFAGTDV